MKLQFDPSQSFQVASVESIVRIFEGLPKTETEFALSGETVPNLPVFEDFNEQLLLENLIEIQRNEEIQIAPKRPGETLSDAELERLFLPESATLTVDEGLPILVADLPDTPHRHPSFTVEMETGTGKTYVYLRTIYELRKRFGFGKFIIVVPSIAIYEGVCKSFDIMKDHFAEIYGNQTVNLIRYDGAQLSRLRDFSTSTFCEIMVMTLDSFNKASNNVYKRTEKLAGEKLPIEYIRETRPIVILDEPQNMGTELSKSAIRSLHPLVSLRYSATHRESPNLTFRLTPFDAFRLGLVKKIEVFGAKERENPNQDGDAAPLLALESVAGTGARIRAQVSVLVRGSSGKSKEDSLTLKKGDDLREKTKREEYAGYIVDEINVNAKAVTFENGVTLLAGGISRFKPEIFRAQIEATILAHFQKQESLRSRGIKVLSLFFIDRVANYTDDDGLIKKIFDEEFNRLKMGRPEWQNVQPETIRRAYFAQKKTAKGTETIETRDVEYAEKNAEEKAAEKEAFNLIMREKERLLSFEEPVAFVFAHSALREGWDNPNVFQICTLNQSVSTMRKRQEIGRGLRLCVDQNGARVQGDGINLLTVVANASYEDYARGLQKEYADDGDAEMPAPLDASKALVKRNPAIFESPAFRDFWKKLCRTASPSFNLDTDELVIECANRLNGARFTVPIVVVERGKFIQTRITLSLKGTSAIGDVRRAEIEVAIHTTDRDNDRITTVNVKVGDNLKDKAKEERLRSFRVASIEGGGDAALVTFGNGISLSPHHPYTTDTQEGFKAQDTIKHTPRESFPVPNLLERAARETGLTRPTLNRIWKAINPQKQKFLLLNPEGFIATFITEVNNALADQITNRMTFTPDGTGGKGPSDEFLEAHFPDGKKFTARELVEGGAKSLYDQVQTDSDVEKNFVARLRSDGPLVLYFKFPATFKVPLPKQIGNYNPDWGIVRLDGNKPTIEMIRETKGSTDVSTLRFPSEIRKIYCAHKYFEALGLDYRPIDDKVADWWLPWQRSETI